MLAGKCYKQYFFFKSSFPLGPTDNSAPTAENPAHLLATGLDGKYK
jgi:hypothetical protein